jgi:cell division protein FtsQ
MLRVTFGIAALVAAGVGAWQVGSALQSNAQDVDGPPVGPPELVTDGVLNQDWLVRTLALPKRSTLMGLDLERLRSRLLADGQVAEATLVRRFPSTLSVHLSERTPVARLRAQAGDGTPKDYLVARDGVVYPGFGYSADLVASLPWLDGVRLERQGSGFAPIAGMQAAASLLSTARLDDEPLYLTWRVVSLARLASDGEIEVRTQDGLKAVFGTQEDFLRQLARLDVVIDTARTQTGTARLSAVNLTYGGQVPATFATNAPPAAAAAPASFSITAPSTNREF